jgi:NAD(P)-dependent dehydrogenase (short-subunit alcohol dehydrogenase family)
VILALAHRAVVLGAAGAIGRAICRTYAEAGANVLAFDTDEEGVQKLMSELVGDGHAAGLVDVTDPGSVERMADDAWRRGPVDSVIYAVGVEFTADVADMDWGEYRRLMAVNLAGAFFTGKAFASRMLGAGLPGAFTFLSSIAGKRGEPGASAYCASKFGLIGFVESFAAEVAEQGIRVNAICPGCVDSPMLRAVAGEVAAREGTSSELVMQRLTNMSAARRLVRPEEVAGACLWLSSPLASAVTGEAIDVDAGALVG